MWPPLKRLDLSDNALRYLPQLLISRWDWLEKLDLTNNKWSCDCDNEYLVSSGKIYNTLFNQRINLSDSFHIDLFHHHRFNHNILIKKYDFDWNFIPIHNSIKRVLSYYKLKSKNIFVISFSNRIENKRIFLFLISSRKLASYIWSCFEKNKKEEKPAKNLSLKVFELHW